MRPIVTGTLLPWEEDARASVERTFARELGRLDETLGLAVKLLERNEELVVKRSRKLSRKSVLLMIGLFGKAVKTTRAVRLVASPALTEDGLVLCRTLLETAVAILYILQKDTPRRTDEYLAHVLVRTKKIMTKWKATPGLRRWGKQIEKRADSHLSPYAYLGESRLRDLRRWYSGDATIETTFKKVGLNRLYQEFYLFTAGIQHVSDISRHIEVGDKGGAVLLMGSSDSGDMRALLDMANRGLWTIMRRVSSKLGMGYEAEIERHRPPRDQTRALVRAWARRQKAREAEEDAERPPT